MCNSSSPDCPMRSLASRTMDWCCRSDAPMKSTIPATWNHSSWEGRFPVPKKNTINFQTIQKKQQKNEGLFLLTDLFPGGPHRARSTPAWCNTINPMYNVPNAWLHQRTHWHTGTPAASWMNGCRAADASETLTSVGLQTGEILDSIQ